MNADVLTNLGLKDLLLNCASSVIKEAVADYRYRIGSSACLKRCATHHLQARTQIGVS